MRLSVNFYFLLVELVASWFVFREGLWGRQLLAPLDIAPAFFPKYRFLNPASTGIPANHHIIDQLTYDLPIQTVIYSAYRSGEIPWWDPYDLAGRPLLADAHINGTDPLRLLAYALLPFESGYNWTLIGHFLLSGIAMFLLLRHFHFQGWQCLLFAITYQFSTSFVLHFAQTWVQASFIYYPLLWLAWDKWVLERSWRSLGFASLLIAGIFYSGSVQTDSYIGMFAAAFALGYAGLNRNTWKRVLGGMLLCFTVALFLAGPVIFGQWELFFLSIRKIEPTFNRWAYLGGIASLSAIYPWALGTFRTLDLSKIADQPYHFGFALFIGSAGACLAVLGVGDRSESAHRLQKQRRMALWLIALYLVVVSTPLVRLVYLRISGLATMGLTVLAAIGLNAVLENHDRFVRAGRWILGLTLVIALAINLFAFAIYPKLIPWVHNKLLTEKTSLPGLPALRAFQASNFPTEVSLRNPEAAIAVLSLGLLALLLMNRALRPQRTLWILLLVLNALPLLLFAHRFVPRARIEMWERLLAGGPEQRKIEAWVRDTPLRLDEVAPSINDRLFPLAMAHLYRLRTVTGYTGLPLQNLETLPEIQKQAFKPQLADLIYVTDKPNTASGELMTNSTPGLARFQWIKDSNRKFEVRAPQLNTIEVRFNPGEAGTLLWTDTFFPGWKAFVDGNQAAVRRQVPCFSTIDIPASAHQLLLRYEPRPLKMGIGTALAGLGGISAMLIPWRDLKRKLKPRISLEGSSIKN